MKYAIITGVSRGLGESVAKRMLDQGVAVLGLSRSKNKELLRYSEDIRVPFYPFYVDISNHEALEDALAKINALVFKQTTEHIYLINNAATVNPIDRAEKHVIEAIKKHVDTNLTAPMITTSALLSQATKAHAQVIVMNITSGAANRSTYGWSLYGSTKAGLNRYTETVALETSERGERHKVVLFDPSIMDTNMQGSIRETNESQFKAVDTFKAYKDNDQLRDTDVVAKVIVELLADEQGLKNGETYSIHDYMD